MDKITIYKLDHLERDVWNYSGEVLFRDPEKVVVQARFTKADFIFNGMLLKKDDYFVEAYYRKKWYNIFEIYDRDDDHLKGWYCNVTRPADIARWKISYQDLALDVFVHFGGESMLLDQDEFKELNLQAPDQEKAWSAVRELQGLLVDQKFRLRTD